MVSPHSKRKLSKTFHFEIISQVMANIRLAVNSYWKNEVASEVAKTSSGNTNKYK